MTLPIALLSGNTILEAGLPLANENSLLQTLNGALSGVLNMQAFTVANGSTGTGTAEQILATYVLPASTLLAVNQGLRITARGSYGATGNNKTVKLYFGSELLNSGAVAGNATAWEAVMEIYKTGTNTQIVNGTFIGNAGATIVQYSAAGAETDTAAITTKLSITDGTSAAADGILNSYVVELIR